MSAKQRPAVIGLTGGVGSGKSTVASMFAELGVPVIDLDLVGHQVTSPGSHGLSALVEQFGTGILDGDQLNRGRLAKICFVSEEKTLQLNRIVHPLIWKQVDIWKQKQDAPYVVIEASVLIESKAFERYDLVVAILAQIQVRRERVMSRPGMTEERFSDITARQCDDVARLKHADVVIYNDRSIEALKTEVVHLNAKFIDQFGS